MCKKPIKDDCESVAIIVQESGRKSYERFIHTFCYEESGLEDECIECNSPIKSGQGRVEICITDQGCDNYDDIPDNVTYVHKKCMAKRLQRYPMLS